MKPLCVVIGLLLLGSCTTESIVSPDGVSGRAIGELSGTALVTALSVASKSGGFVNVADEWNYFGGIVPMNKAAWLETFGGRVDNGTRLTIDGRQRGCFPQLCTLPKPGPHRIQVEVPVFEPFLLVLGDPIR